MRHRIDLVNVVLERRTERSSILRRLAHPGANVLLMPLSQILGLPGICENLAHVERGAASLPHLFVGSHSLRLVFGIDPERVRDPVPERFMSTG